MAEFEFSPNEHEDIQDMIEFFTENIHKYSREGMYAYHVISSCAKHINTVNSLVGHINFLKSRVDELNRDIQIRISDELERMKGA